MVSTKARPSVIFSAWKVPEFSVFSWKKAGGNHARQRPSAKFAGITKGTLHEVTDGYQPAVAAVIEDFVMAVGEMTPIH